MNSENFIEKLKSGEFFVPIIKKETKVKGTIIKRTEGGILVSCEDGTFTGIILPKEAKELERNGVDLSVGVKLEAEVLDPDIQDDQGYFVISISKLLQYDVWNNILEKSKTDEVITVIPTEANLGGLLIDMHGIKGFIPLSQLAPVHYPRVEDGDQEKIFERLIHLIGKEFRVRIINIDPDGKRMILSEREALREEREKILSDLEVGKIYEGTVSGLSSYGLFVTIGGGIEGLVHISEITFGHVDNIEKYGIVGNKVEVKVIGYEDGKISLSMKKLKGDPWSHIKNKLKVGDIVEGEVVRFVPYGAFVRVYDDINGLVHLSETSDRPISNPAEAFKLGQIVKAKIILIDAEVRKIGLSTKALLPESDQQKSSPAKKPMPKRPVSRTPRPATKPAENEAPKENK